MWSAMVTWLPGFRAGLYFLFTMWLVKMLEPHLSSSPLMIKMGVMTLCTMQGQCEVNQINIYKISRERCGETIV